MVKVVGWGTEKEMEDRNDPVGSMGGFFQDGMRWQDLKERFVDSAHPYLEALRAEIIEKKLRFGGDGHQDDKYPLFDDGSTAFFSYRAWGDLMAAIWSEHEAKDYCYMDFYMDCCVKDDFNDNVEG